MSVHSKKKEKETARNNNTYPNQFPETDPRNTKVLMS